LKRLLIRPGGIGDCLLCAPALEWLAREADAEIWAPAAVVPLLARIAPARAISSTGLDLLEIGSEAPRAVVERLRGFGEIVSWYGGNRAQFREAAARYGLPFRFLEALPPREGERHAADFFLKQVGGEPPAIPAIPVEAVGAGGIYLHPFSGSAKKNWELHKFRALAEGLPGPVYWLRGEEDPALDEAIGPMTLVELARRLAGARLYVGNDSGVSHLAAAVGAPVVALFGPTDARVWAPRGRGRVEVVTGMEDARVEQVVDACSRILC
jgi:heptosyltransferase-3